MAIMNHKRTELVPLIEQRIIVLREMSAKLRVARSDFAESLRKLDAQINETEDEITKAINRQIEAETRKG
jgi:hypothetical protein